MIPRTCLGSGGSRWVPLVRWILTAGLVVVGLSGCGGAQARPGLSEGAQRRDTAVEHEPCDVDGKGAERVDANGDGRPDIVIVRDGGREVCRAVDLNLDGTFDRWTYLDEGGAVRRQESDYDRDGRIDEIAIFRGGVVIERQAATTLHHQLDTWHFYDQGKLVRTERDSNGDGVVDQWWEYRSPECPLIHSDVNNDGRPDPGATIDYCKETGSAPPLPAEQQAELRRFDQPLETVTEVEGPPAEATGEESPAEEAGGDQ